MMNENDPKNEFEKIDFDKIDFGSAEPGNTEPDTSGTDNWDEKPKYDGPEEKRYYTQYTPPTPGNGIIPERPVMPPRDSNGKVSKILGFIGLALALCLNRIAGIVLGIIALCKANKSIRTLGHKSSDATAGKVLGIIDIVLGVLMLVFIISYFCFLFYTGLFEEMVNELPENNGFDWSHMA